MDGPARRETGDSALFMKIIVGDKAIRAYVDTCASDCFMSQEFRDKIPDTCIQDVLSSNVGKIDLADNSTQDILETVRIGFKVAGSRAFYDFNVVERLCHDVVIGRNLMAALRTDVGLPGPWIEVFCGNPVTSTSTHYLPPMTEKIIPVRTWREVDQSPGDGVFCAPASTAPVVVEGGVNIVGRDWWLKVMNPLDKIQIFTPDDVLAFVEKADIPELCEMDIEPFLGTKNALEKETPIALCRLAVSAVQKVANCKAPKAPDKGNDEVDTIDLSESCLDEDQKKKFKQMLTRNRLSLAFTMEELGNCDIAPMKIRVDETQGVISSRPYRYSPQKMDIIDEQIRQLLDIGVIEPSESAWRSPLVVVQKKDGKPRLCTDFRLLNMITYKDKFPMPTARSLFLYMAYKKPTIWTALDLLSGYHQCVIEENSRHYTAFETPMGIYQYKRVAFGLIGAPWQFTKVMAIALKGLMPRVCLAYLDDIIVYDTSFEEHLRSVELVLQALAKADLKVKPSKCEWCRSEINFLGHVVSAEGVKTQKRNIEKVQAFNRPHNAKTVKSFMGICNYYRAFVPNFSEISVPLNHLQKKGVPFKWTDECEQAFQKLKDKLMNPPLLIHPDIGGHFHVLTDASDTACGAAVCHRIEETYRPIAFWGCTMRDAELNYTVTEKEALAVVRALKHFEDMLQGAKVTIVTDHKPLVPLLQAAYKAPSARLKRWALALSDFDFEIVYEPGATHFLPDYLSRVQTREPESSDCEPEVGCELFALRVSLDELEMSVLITEQNKDPECSEIIEFLENGFLPIDPDLAQQVIAKSDSMAVLAPGVLCKFTTPRARAGKALKVNPRAVVPPALVASVLKLLHNDVLAGGHVGTSALTEKVMNRFYWRNMHKDILDYVRACETCSLRKRAPHFKAMAKSWERPSRPWQWVQCDFIGPLKKASNGSKYIMTFIDLLTGWPEAFCTKDSTAATAAEVFLQGIVCRYGKVERLHSDRGSTFLSELFREVTTRLACRQSFTTGRMPTGNARVERMHKTLENIVACYISDDHTTWPDLVPVALWTIRSTTSVRTGFSPYSLLFGQDPVSMGLPEHNQAPDSLNDNEFFLRIRDNIALFRHMAESVADEYERDLRDRIDRHARPVDFYEGDLVYVYDPTCSANRTSKFADKYKGPYRVIQVKGDNLVRLTSVVTGKEIPHLINVSKLKRAYEPWNPAISQLSHNPMVPDQSKESHVHKTADAEYSAEDAEQGRQENKAGTPALTQPSTNNGAPQNKHKKQPVLETEPSRPNRTDQQKSPEQKDRRRKKRTRGKKKKKTSEAHTKVQPKEQSPDRLSSAGRSTDSESSHFETKNSPRYVLRRQPRPNYSLNTEFDFWE